MKKLILDVDSVGDDILAMIYGALNRDIELLGITTVFGASGSISQSTNVALEVIKLTQKDIIIYSGEEEPLSPQKNIYGDPINFFEKYRTKYGKKLDRFNTLIENSEHKASNEKAVDFIIKTVEKYPGEVTLVCTGPLTNLARVILQKPDIALLIKEVYILGGVFFSPGNISPVTEYNIQADPEAAKTVLNSNLKIYMVPLDVCENNKFATTMMTRDHLEAMKLMNPSSRITNYITKKFPIYIDIWRDCFDLVGFPMDDVITLAIASGFKEISYYDEVSVDVELEGKYCRGQTIAFFGKQINEYDEIKNKKIKILKDINGVSFMEHFIEIVTQDN